MRLVSGVVLSLLTVLSTPAFAQRQLIWGETEIIGIKRLSREQVTSQLPIKPGEAVSQNEKDMLKWCERLKKLPIAAVSCNGAMVGTRLHYVVEILEDASADPVLQPSTAPRAAARVPPEARQLIAQREYRVQEVLADGYMPGERITPSGIVVAEDPELRTFDAQLRDLANGQQERMIAIALDARHPERKDAIVMLNWTGRPEASIAALHGRLLDPDSEVRNLTGRLVLTFIEWIKDPAVADALAGTLAQVLTLPSHTDRTKALAAMGQLYALHPEIRGKLQRVAREPLTEIARTSVLPNVGGDARGLLAAIGD